MNAFTIRLAAALAAALLAGAGGCGYMTRGLYPTHIQTVSVPIFKSKGLRRDIEFQLTEKVIKAIESQTPLKVVASGGDSELRGTIESFFKTSNGEDGYDNPRGGVMNMILSVSWIDNTSGRVIHESSQTFTIQALDAYAINLAQSQATAMDRVVGEMADSIVAMMQAPW